MSRPWRSARYSAASVRRLRASQRLGICLRTKPPGLRFSISEVLLSGFIAVTSPNPVWAIRVLSVMFRPNA